MKPSDRRITARLQQANYTAVEWADANPVLLNGERGIESNTGREKIGDGITPWNGLRYMDEVCIENISGSSVVLDVAGGHTYLCGTLASLTLRSVVDSPREAVIRFRSGAVAATLSLPDTLEVVGYSVPAANMTYEINIASNRAVIVGSAR